MSNEKEGRSELVHGDLLGVRGLTRRKAAQRRAFGLDKPNKPYASHGLPTNTQTHGLPGHAHLPRPDRVDA